MIDLHCHMLPGIDDGAPDLETALRMANMAVDDGINVTACTPHIMPGVYDNEPAAIRRHVEDLREALARADIPLELVFGSDAHMRPEFATAIGADKVLTLNHTRYVLFEPPHNVVPPRLEEFLFGVQVAGYVPILTHPERLAWVEMHYPVIERLAQAGVWMQITAGSLAGTMGRRPRYWAEKMLGQGLVHILASDAHNCTSRPPVLSHARERAAELLGAEEALHMVVTRPAGILDNADPGTLPEPIGAPRETPRAGRGTSLWRRMINVVKT